MDAVIDSFKTHASSGGGDILDDVVTVSTSYENSVSLSKLISTTEGEVSADDIVNFVSYLIQHIGCESDTIDETQRIDLVVGKLLIQILNALKLARYNC